MFRGMFPYHCLQGQCESKERLGNALHSLAMALHQGNTLEQNEELLKTSGTQAALGMT